MVRFKVPSPTAWLVAIAVCWFFGQAFVSVARAQTQTPTPEQMEMLQNLPPEQRQAILDSLARGDSRISSPGVRTDRPLDFPPIVRPRERAADEDAEESDLGVGETRLKAGDTILLSLEIRQFERPAPEVEERARREKVLTPAQPGASSRQGQLPAQAASAARATDTQLKSIERTEEEMTRLQDFRERVLRRNPYKLDRWGILNVPELGPIPLGGLTVEQATQRLGAELRLNDFILLVTRLPLKKYGAEALKPFGYDLFSGAPTTFAPVSEVPVPAEYVVGPGDTIEVQLIGNTKGRYSLVVGRDGTISFPELGPIVVSGRRFEQVRDELESRVRQQMIGTQASIGMGQLRSIRIFVLGDAETPGSYTVSGLSTITNALFVSGGVKKIGSLRNIQLKRAGKTVTTLDLYDLLLKGDTRADVRLLPGDVIFIPPVGATVGLAGQVRRPAIYELKSETTAGELLELGGGLLPDADPTLATLERVSSQRERITVDLDLSQSSGRGATLQGGDLLRVPVIRPVLENSITTLGHLYRPGVHEFRPGMRLVDVIPGVDELKPNADQHYILIRRELSQAGRIAVFSADLEQAISDPSSSANFELAPRDRIYVFDLEAGRERFIEPLLRELRMQARIGEPTREVSIAGKVKVPGKYPFEPGMRVSDLLRAGGSLDESAYGARAELTRYEIVDGHSRQAELIEIDLDRVLAGDPAANIPLKPFDYVVIKEVPLWGVQEEVEIRGEVRFPGRYPIQRGETLKSLMERAGGLTELAFPQGTIFTREELKERERQQLQTLATRMESDLAQFSLMTAQEAGKDAGEALTVGQSLLAHVREAKPVGRLVIDLNRSMNARPGSELDIVLKNGDRVLVPRVTQEVTVIGEVQSVTSHLYRANLSRDDYIAMSGGLTPRADADHIYVVRADGSVVTRSGSRWFNPSGVDIRPGDTIVAPLDTERMRPLPFWTGVMSIVYQLAVSAAAINSFSN